MPASVSASEARVGGALALADGQHHPDGERAEREHRRRREPPVQVDQDAKREHGRQDRPGELDETRAHQNPDAFGVVHDPRDEHAGLRRIEIANRKAKDVRGDLRPHVGDGPLGGDAEHL